MPGRDPETALLQRGRGRGGLPGRRAGGGQLQRRGGGVSGLGGLGLLVTVLRLLWTGYELMLELHIAFVSSSTLLLTCCFSRPADPHPHLLHLPGLGHAAGAADGGVSGGGAGLQGVQPAGLYHPATARSYRWVPVQYVRRKSFIFCILKY